jgi:hypothetical protein
VASTLPIDMYGYPCLANDSKSRGAERKDHTKDHTKEGREDCTCTSSRICTRQRRTRLPPKRVSSMLEPFGRIRSTVEYSTGRPVWTTASAAGGYTRYRVSVTTSWSRAPDGGLLLIVLYSRSTSTRVEVVSRWLCSYPHTYACLHEQRTIIFPKRRTEVFGWGPTNIKRWTRPPVRWDLLAGLPAGLRSGST